jgi:hypothetical protein
MSDLIAELDRIIDRIVRNNPVLVLERESEKWWIVVDTANGGEVMMRAERELCVRFMRAFVIRHPDASFDQAAVEHSWAVAQGAHLRMLPQLDEAS